MTYEELLKETAARKRRILSDLDTALKGPAGFLVEAEIRRAPGRAAWSILAKEFCEKLAEHVDEFMDEDRQRHLRNQILCRVQAEKAEAVRQVGPGIQGPQVVPQAHRPADLPHLRLQGRAVGVY